MVSELLAKEPLHGDSKETEMMVLGCMLTNQAYFEEGARVLKVNDFYYVEHQKIFSSLSALLQEGRMADVHLLCEKLKEKGQLSEAGGIAYITTLAQYVGTSAYFESYWDDLIDHASRRALFDTLSHNIARPPEELLKTLIRQAEGYVERKTSIEPLYQYLLEPSSELKVSEEVKTSSPGISVGLKIGQIELKLPGGQITIIAGPTSHGKTSLLTNLCLGALNWNPGKSVYFFSYEESMSSITTLFLNTFIDKELSKNNRESIDSFLRDGSLKYIRKELEEDFVRDKNAFFQNLVSPGRLNIFYADMSIEQLVRAIHFLKKNRDDIGMICIDYMQLLRLSKNVAFSRQEELKQICLMLKDCAVATGLPIVLAAQFNRQVVAEADLSPTNIGEAGDIERVASMIIGFWNRKFLGFSREGNKTKAGEIIKEPRAELYIEILKGRKIGNNHSEVLSFNGNTGKIQNKLCVC